MSRRTKKKKEDELQQTVMFRTFNVRKRKIDWFEGKQIEKALAPMLSKLEVLRRGEIYGSISAVFFEKEDARKTSHSTYHTEDIDFIPLYMGRRMAEVRVDKLPNRQDPLKVIAAILKPIMGENGSNTSSSAREQILEGQVVQLRLQVEPSALQEIPEALLPGEEQSISTCKEGNLGASSARRWGHIKKLSQK